MTIQELHDKALKTLIAGDKRTIVQLPVIKRRKLLITFSKITNPLCTTQMQKDLMVYPILDAYSMWTSENSIMLKEIEPNLLEVGEILFEVEDALFKKSPLNMSSEELQQASEYLKVTKRIKAPKEKSFAPRERKEKIADIADAVDF